MIKNNVAKSAIDQHLLDVVTPLGFSRLCPLEYQATVNDSLAILAFPVRMIAHGVAAFTLIAGLRFSAISCWLGDEDERRSTCAVPIGQILPNKKYLEWRYESDLTLRQACTSISNLLVTHVVPFLNEYSHMDRFRSTIESSDKSGWLRLGIDVDRRLCILAVFKCLDNDTVGALQIIDDALEERKNELPKRRYGLSLVRKRILASKTA